MIVIKTPLLVFGIMIVGLFVMTLLGFGIDLGKRIQVANMETITFTAGDGVKIAADYYIAPNSHKAAILVHMMPSTKESWRDFAPKLIAKNYNALAIDLRGHGKSDRGPQGFQRFSDAEHQASIRDIEAAAEFLEQSGVKRENIICIGASIGANLCLQYITEHPETKQAVLLSPGLNYLGIETEPFMSKLRPGQRIFIVGSKDDRQSNLGVLSKLSTKTPSGAETESLIYEKAGHGTNMLAPSKVGGVGRELPDLAQEIINWLER